MYVLKLFSFLNNLKIKKSFLGFKSIFFKNKAMIGMNKVFQIFFKWKFIIFVSIAFQVAHSL